MVLLSSLLTYHVIFLFSFSKGFILWEGESIAMQSVHRFCLLYTSLYRKWMLSLQLFFFQVLCYRDADSQVFCWRFMTFVFLTWTVVLCNKLWRWRFRSWAWMYCRWLLFVLVLSLLSLFDIGPHHGEQIQ